MHSVRDAIQDGPQPPLDRYEADFYRRLVVALLKESGDKDIRVEDTYVSWSSRSEMGFRCAVSIHNMNTAWEFTYVTSTHTVYVDEYTRLGTVRMDISRAVKLQEQSDGA